MNIIELVLAYFQYSCSFMHNATKLKIILRKYNVSFDMGREDLFQSFELWKRLLTREFKIASAKVQLATYS